MTSTPDVSREVFLQALRYWLQSLRYHVGFEPGGVATEVDGPSEGVMSAVGKVAEIVGNAALPMAITGGGSAEEALGALVPFLPHCDLLAYRSHLGTPTVVPVILGDGLAPEALRERFATYVPLGQGLVDLGLGFNGQGMGAAVSPLVLYFEPETYDALGGAAVLAGGYHTPRPADAALDRDRVSMQATAVHVPTRRVDRAQPDRPHPAVARLLSSAIKRAMTAFNVRTETFTEADLTTVMGLAQHFARTA